MSHDLSEKDIEELHDAFALFDLDKSGAIDAKELATVMRSLGTNPTDAEVKSMLADVDGDGSGQIEFDEFSVLMARKFRGGDNANEELYEAFRTFDEDNTGYISVADLQTIVSALAAHLSSEEVDEIVQLVDGHGDGRISYPHFVDLMKMGQIAQEYAGIGAAHEPPSMPPS